MIWIDYAILAIVGISGVISLMRGFIREALSLAGWIAAFWVALAFSGKAAAWLVGYVSVPSVRVGIAFAAIFFGVLLLCGIVLRLAGLLVERTGMSGTDRTLGIVFGVLRGVVVTAVLVLLAGLTALPRDPWWNQSVLLPHLVELANEVRAFLPPDMQRQIQFGPDS
ncbi:MAG: CvpA family protein [Gammaproteobacteria bacterium]|nr:CvpA family protein [Gammaproteobacteria bacterium]